MKKRNIGMLLLYLILGWLVGAWVAKLLQPVKALSFLTKSTLIKWSPQADLDIISYDVTIQLKLCMLSLIGIIIAVWLYRRK
ncbi:protein of unknown function [Paenibacillus sophorae]|uniref:DUF4321 domain-containing protein n=1 Tax=Paenibacillus sophorae TaxID=1333845 RepID=A0A1H8QK66_9BACL|nr:DUF4321 domain-containing protein [Paenibacillus sophorae]QWU15094.1 DUF4321 domain-containing protein [Paenibacillus sophorae]SEO54630.1 protein of unknown function [Paenibacillus sophorae]